MNQHYSFKWDKINLLKNSGRLGIETGFWSFLSQYTSIAGSQEEFLLQ